MWLHGVEDDSRIEKANVTEVVCLLQCRYKLLKTDKPRQSVVKITKGVKS